MTRINHKANFTQELSRERERLISAIQHEIDRAAKKDPSALSEIQTEFSEETLRSSILLIIALGESQYFWLCYWKDGHSGAYAYDEEDFPDLKDCDQHTSTEKVAEILGLSDDTLLYAERIERKWIINTTYSDEAAKHVTHKLVQIHKQSTEQTEKSAGGKPMGKGSKIPGWIKDFLSTIVMAVGAVVYLVLTLFDTDIKAEPLAVLFVTVPLGIWLLWKFGTARRATKILISVATVVIVVGLVYYVFQSSKPRFEITAFNTLEADRNAYEVTDQLLWHYDELNEFGVAITFTLEIVPKYNGKQQFGSVIALISGDGDRTYEKELWPHFDGGSSTWQIQLTLEELLKASGLQRKSHPPVNRFRPGDPFVQQAELVVQIARAADKEHPWATEHIVVRNAPWEFRSALVERDGRRALDVFVENLGGTGEFAVRYRLVRLKREIDSSSDFHEVHGITSVAGGNEPSELVRLERGQFFTDTIFLTEQLAQGRYLVEAYAIKKQNYVQFISPHTTWSDINSLDSCWWLGEYPSNRHIFVIATSEFPMEEIVQTDVHANQSWQDTGVHVQRGDRIIIVQIGGAWSVFESGTGFHDANGVPGWFGAEAPLPQACLGTLIARVGTDDDHIFQVGCWGEHTSQAEGNLYLAINDKIIEDNAGRLMVQIITPAKE